LPRELLVSLRLAIRNGETARLNELIERVGERDTEISRALKKLADNYEYDALTHLLEGATQ
jgi:DnaJ-domain-containing protein 1